MKILLLLILSSSAAFCQIDYSIPLGANNPDVLGDIQRAVLRRQQQQLNDLEIQQRQQSLRNAGTTNPQPHPFSFSNIQPFTSEKLVRVCKTALRLQESPNQGDGKDTFDSAQCIGYLYGALDANGVWMAANPDDPSKPGIRHYCLPPTASNEQLVRVTVKYIENNPKLLDQLAWTSVQLSMTDAFPCPATASSAAKP